MDEEEVEAVVERKKEEIKRELRDELTHGDTRIDASLGMFDLQINSNEDLESTVEAFEEIWENRVEEIEDSMANTLKEKLESRDGGLFIG